MLSRNSSLDALRGWAILAMVLSGSIAFGPNMPAWMFHAQVPPPDHKFNPALPGITWVDLVFPFFLFSMGAAIPLALKKVILLKEGSAKQAIIIAAKRFLLLAFFSVFSTQVKAWVIFSTPSIQHHLLSILGFVALFFMLLHNKAEQVILKYAKVCAYVIALAMLFLIPFEKGFSFGNNDIIIMVLANMAFFGTLIYYFTKNNITLRMALLPFIFAIFLAAKEPNGGFLKFFFEWNSIGSFKIDWLYKFYFLKYLFIVLPGTLVGDWLLVERSQTKSLQHKNWMGLICFTLVVANVTLLFSRHLLSNFICSILLLLTLGYLVKKAQQKYLTKMFSAGAYLLLLGLFFEAYEGGIKKDSSTYSYYFVTSGLAIFSLLFFDMMQQQKILSRMISYMAKIGQNPMLAYVAGSLLLMPAMHLIGAYAPWDNMNQGVGMGLLKGVVFTGLVSIITLISVKKGWFWRT